MEGEKERATERAVGTDIEGGREGKSELQIERKRDKKKELEKERRRMR